MAYKKKSLDEVKLVSWIKEEFQRYEQYHAERFAKAEKYYDYWIGKPPKRLEHQNAIHVPMTIEAEQTITPRLLTALFPTDAPVDCQVEGDTKPQAGVVVKNLIQHYFRVSNVQGKFTPILTQNTLFGTAYGEGGSWLVKRGWIIGAGGERYYTIIDSRPDCTPVSFFEIYPHPAKVVMDDGLPLIRRRFVDSETLKSLQENPFFDFKNLDKALDSKLPGEADKLGPSYQLKKGDRYEVLEYWGPYTEQYEDENGKLSEKKAVPYWCIIINREVVVRAVPNPYNHQIPPFIKVKLYEDAKPGWFGVGIGGIGEPTQERINKIVSNRLDNVDIIINKMLLYNKNDALLNKKQLEVSKPGKAIGVSDIETSIKYIDIPDVTAEAYKEEEMAKQDFRESTGATSAMMPSDNQDEQHRTAMGIQLLQGAAGMRLRPVLKNIEIDGIQQLAMFYFSNCKQFMTVPQWIQVTGDQGQKFPVKVSPEDIQAKIFFIPTGISETVNKETQIGQLLRFKEVTMNDPTVNRAEVNKRIAELFGFKDLDKLIVPQQPIQQTPGGLNPAIQEKIRQRLAEGASPESIKMELMGQKPPEEQMAPEAVNA